MFRPLIPYAATPAASVPLSAARIFVRIVVSSATVIVVSRQNSYLSLVTGYSPQLVIRKRSASNQYPVTNNYSHDRSQLIPRNRPAMPQLETERAQRNQILIPIVPARPTALDMMRIGAPARPTAAFAPLPSPRQLQRRSIAPPHPRLGDGEQRII